MSSISRLGRWAASFAVAAAVVCVRDARAQGPASGAPARTHEHGHDHGAAPSSGGLAIGAVAPSRDVRMRNVDGHEVTIASVAGSKGTLVVFTCNHCPWARAWEARLTALGNDFQSRGIGVIAINSNDPAQHEEDRFEVMQERARAAGMHFPYVEDATSNVARAFGATRTPEVFLLDRRARLVYHGAIDDNAFEASAVQHHYLRDALEALATDRPISQAETRSMGCGIKFRSESATPR